MSVNLLAINVGNTRVQVGSFLDGRMTEPQRFTHDQLDGLADAVLALHEPLRDAIGSAVYLSSVNDEAAERVLGVVEEKLGVLVLRVERDVHIPIGRHLDPEAIVGEDRLLNAAAAYERFKQACIVVDAGTAVTVDFVDGTGTFQGGAIFPGLATQARSLRDSTSLLPLVEAQKPIEAIGHNTVEAIRSGLFHGIRGAVRELVEKYAEMYLAYPKVVATGGDAVLLFDGYELVESIVPQLTLEGMAVAHRYATQDAE